MLRLVVFLDDVFEGVHHLEGDRVTVGRRPDNHLVFDHESISRLHASFVREDEGWVVVDEGATNGVFLNGKVVERALLRDGDRVELGAYRLVVGEGDGATAVSARTDEIDAGAPSAEERVHRLVGRCLPFEGLAEFVGDLGRLVADELDVDRLLLVLREGRGGKHRVLLRKGFSDEAIGARSPWMALLRSVAERGRVLVSTDAEEGLVLDGEEGIGEEQLRAVLSIPFTVGERCVAVLYLDRPHRRAPWRKEEIRFLGILAERAAHWVLVGMEREELLRANRVFRAVNEELVSLDGVVESIVAEDVRMRQVVRLLREGARGPSWILLRGEPGVGKEYFARAIHLLSERCEAPFVRVDCAAGVSESLEAFFFGRQGEGLRHPGRLEMAHGGTLYLHDVHALGPSFQKKLLQALQEGAVLPVGGTEAVDVDCRLVASTPHDLVERVRAHRFREDFQIALSELVLAIPPLRERPDDVLPLAEHFLRWYGRECGGRKLAFDDEARRALRAHGWTGNTRELRIVVEWVVLHVGSGTIGVADLPI